MAGKIYKCLNPIGNQDPVDLTGLERKINAVESQDAGVPLGDPPHFKEGCHFAGFFAK